MKILFMVTVLVFMTLSPASAVDVHSRPVPLLVASSDKDTGKREPPVIIIKGQGGKVTDVEKGDKKKKKKKK